MQEQLNKPNLVVILLLPFSIMLPTPRAHGSGSCNIKVFVRIRPLLSTEQEEGARNIIHVSSTEREVCIFSCGLAYVIGSQELNGIW